MATVDDRVVAMSFENSKFNSDVDSTVGVLGKLKQALNLDGAARGLEDINTAGQSVDLSHIGGALQGLTSGFSVLGGAAAVVLGNIATKALEVGGQLVNSFSFAPIVQGFHDYETQINAVQTIMANTGLTGAQGLSKVTGVLKDMQNYANLTVYNFADMAKNIGTFTAAGVDLKTAQESIKGIANLAALSGSNSEQASGAMYQLSQAIAAGKVQLQDWNSVVNAGIGGKVFQEALFNTAKAMGTLKDVPLGESFDQWTKAGNSFRQSLQRGSQAATEATSPVAKLAQAHKDAARTIEDAQRQAADAVTSAAQRVKDAQRGVGDSVRASAQAIASAADGVRQAQQASSDAVRQAAKDIQNAIDGVSQAQQSLASVNRQASQDIASAVQQEHQTITQSAQSVHDALLAVIDARKKLAEAMKPPSADELQAAQDKLTTAQLDQKDLTDAVTKAQEDQTRATEDLTFAQKNLADLQASGTATPEQIIMAQRQVQDAQEKVTQLTDAQTRALLQQHSAARAVDQAQTDLQNTQEKGTKADKNVQTAQDALTKALTAYRDAQIKSSHDIAAAEQNVRDVRIKSAQSQLAAQQALTKAEQNLSDTRVKASQNELNAQQAVAKAEKNLADVRITQAENEQKAQESLAQAEHDQAKARIDSAESVAKAHEQAAKTILAAEQAVKPKGQSSTWLTSGVLTNTLKQFSGDMTTAQLKAQGFSDAQIKDIESMGKTAVNAATQVKTFSQLMQALREEVATAWSNVFSTLFGNINQAKDLFSPLHQTLENMLTNPIKALNVVLQDWAKAGGRTALIDSFKTAWSELGKVLATIKTAWSDIFPSISGNQLADLTKNFDAFIHRLEPSKQTLNDIGRIFKGLFAVLDIGKTVLVDVFHLFEHLFGVVGPSAGGGFLALAAHVGDLLVKFDQMVKSGHFLTDFFAALAQVIDHPLQAFKDLGITLPPLSGVMNELRKIWDAFTGSLQKSSGVLGPLSASLGHLFNAVVTFLTNTFQNLNFDQVLHAIDVGLLGGIYLLFKKFFGSAKLSDLAGGGIFKGVKEVLEGVTGSLKQMQTTLKAATLVEIGVALLALATALIEIGSIPSNKLKSSLVGLGALMAELAAAMKAISVLSEGGLGAVKLAAVAAGMIALAGAVDLLVVAVKELAGLDWQQIMKGLTGVGALLVEIAFVSEPLSANSKGMITAGLGIIAIATGIRILVGAVRGFGDMNLSELAKGLGAVGVALGTITLAAKFIPTSGMIGMGLGLIGVATAMKIMGSAMQTFADLDVHGIAVGIFAIATSLGTIALAMNLMPKGLAIQAIGLDLVAFALIGIARAIKDMGSISGDNIAKGLIAMGFALTELAIALDAMQGSLPGATALVVAATGLDLLAPALRIIGSMSIGDLAKGLVAMGIALGGLALGAQLLEPAAPALLAMGVALISVGTAVALIGGGIFLLGTGLSEIAVAGPAAIAILLKALEGFAASVPKLLSGVVDSIVHIAVALADAAPQIVTALGKLLVALGQAIIDAAPVLANAGIALIEGLLKVITKAYPDLVKAGIGMLLALLKGIADNIGKIVTEVANIITHFLSALAKHLPEIIRAGAELLAKFIVGIADGYTKIGTAAVTAVIHFVNGVANNLHRIVSAGVNLIGKFISAIANGALQLLRTGATTITHFLSGVASLGKQVVLGAAHVISVFISSAEQAALGLVKTGVRTIINFLNGIAQAIRQNSKDFWNAGWNIVSAIIEGMVQGVDIMAHHVWDKIKDLVNGIPGIAKHILGISSPSKVFNDIGENIVLGLAQGITNTTPHASNAVFKMVDRIVGDASNASSQLHDLLNFDSPVITPVLDLSEVQKQAYLIPGYFPDVPVKPPLYISAPGQSGQDTQPLPQSGGGSGEAGVPVVSFTQINNSPQALSEVDIYRQTKNQLSQLGGSTNISDAAYFAGVGK